MTATQSNKAPVKAGLFDRLKSGPVICAEGYLFELERRGYLQAGAFVPEAVVENPEGVKRLHEDFVHAGSDVVEAFTYYAHRPEAQGNRPREYSGRHQPAGSQDRQGRR